MTPGEKAGFVFLGALFIEAVLLAFWVPAYFRRGIPVFREVLRIPCQPEEIAATLSTQFTNTVSLPRLVFRQISEYEVAFQEAGGITPLWSYLPIMRGLICARPDGTTVVVGILQWYPIVAAAAVAVGLASSGPAVVALALVGIVILTFIVWVVQRMRFRAVVVSLTG
jgi:hypothetical protein